MTRLDRLLDDLRQDLRHAWRASRHRPGFAAAAILTLAVGIGATTAIFSVVKSVVINPLAYPDADALVRIVHSIGGIEQPYFDDSIFVSYADNTQSLQGVGVWTPEATAIVTGRGDPEEVPVLRASHGVLTTLGVLPELGRWLSASDDTPGAPDVVMVSHAYWQRRLGGDPAVLQQALTINARPHQIVGVMPESFRFQGEFDLIVPLRINRGQLLRIFRLNGVARMKPGVTVAQANADAMRVLQVWFDNFKVSPQIRPRWSPLLQSLKQEVLGDIGRTLWILLSAVGVVLLMACANVANLLLVRAESRRREFAIRAALGAAWARVARQLLAESLALAAAGGVLGVAIAFAAVRLLRALGPANLPRLDEISLDPAVLAFAVIISAASGLLFGLFPVLKYARPRIATRLGRDAALTRDRQRSQQILVAAQIALALILVVSAGLMIRSFQALRRVAPGFSDPQRVQTLTISIPVTLAAEPEQVTRVQQDLMDRIGGIPGVDSTSFTTRVPMGSNRFSAALTVEGRADDGKTPPNRHVKIVSPGTFRTLGTPVVAGRDFTWTDVHDRRPVAIVSENLARGIWGSPAAALGQRVREYYNAKSPFREIVGVVGDVYDDGADEPAPETVHWPAQPIQGYPSRRVTVMIRSERAGTAGFLTEVRQAVRSTSAALPLADVQTLDVVYDGSLARTSFTLALLAIAGTMALLLGMSGLYAVIAYAVSRRRREIGVRLALGAKPSEVRRLFLRRGLIVTGSGLVIGLAGALTLTRLLRSLLFGTSPSDPLAFAAMSGVLAAASLVASYLPARAAAAVDPVETLRAE
jgi:predicted permease